VLIVMVSFVAVYGLWARQGLDDAQRTAAEAPGALIQAATGTGTSLAAVGRAAGLASPCTAWLLDVGAPPEAPAHAVTTGRCVGVTDVSVVESGVALPRASVSFRAFAPRGSSRGRGLVEAPVDTLEWASVRGTDLAVLRLGTTYGELVEQGVRPITAVAPAGPGAEILVAGVPVEGVDPRGQYLRGSRCQVGTTTDVVEGSWLWDDLQESGCRGILRGSLGSVVLNEAGQAVGMVSTTTIGAADGPDCIEGRPCEVGPEGVRVARDTSYMVGLEGLAACVPEGRFVLGPTCPLEDPTGVVPAEPSTSSARPGAVVQVEVGQAPGAQPGARVWAKEGDLEEVDCAGPFGWRSAGRTLEVQLPAQPGFTVVCVGSAEQPTTVVLRVDATRPDAARIDLLETPVIGGVRVQPVADPPELVGFRWVSAPEGALDCGTAEGYVTYDGQPAMIQAADLPATVCVIGIDAAGNESAPSTHVIE